MSTGRNIVVPPQPADPFEPCRPIEPGVTPTLARVAGLLRRVVNYGKQLAMTVRLRAETPAVCDLARAFRTADLWVVLGRIQTAISRAVHLEDKLLFETGHGMRADEARMRADVRAARAAEREAFDENDATAAVRDPLGGRDPAAVVDPAAGVDPHAAPDPDPAEDAEDRALVTANKPPRAPREPAEQYDDGLPSTAHIIAELRTRSVGAVLADICRDLGITENHPLWPELAAAIATFGGDLAELEQEAADGTRWCSQTWMELPYPQAPAIPYFSTLMLWETYQQLADAQAGETPGPLPLPAMQPAPATGPP